MDLLNLAALSTASPRVDAVFYAFEWAIRLGALAVVPFRRTPDAARGWLLLIFFLPLPGLILFLAIGRPEFPAWRKDRFARLAPYFTQTSRAQHDRAPKADERQPIADLAETLGHMPLTGGNRVELIDNYNRAVERLIADIDAARVSVEIVVYIFADDAVGQRIAAALARAVARGVACRVLIDAVGSWHWRRGTLAMLRSGGVDVREALPFRLIHRTRRDMRNHRKLFVIDGRIGHAGSQNLVARDFRPGIVNRELVARVEGPAVAQMLALVRGDWFLETGEEPALPPAVEPCGDALVQLLPSGPDYRIEGFEALLIWQLHQARERVVIVTPYLIPDADVIGAMRTAVARGVAVELVISAVVDQTLVNLSQCSYYDELLTAGVRIHRYRDELLHAKNLVIDHALAVVGSSNVDLRSFQLNIEASLLLYDAATIDAVIAVQQGYLARSDRLDLDQWRARPRWRKLAENIARLFNSLL